QILVIQKSDYFRIITEEWVSQQLSGRPSLAGLLLQATLSKASKLIGHAFRQSQRLTEVDDPHEDGPIGSPTCRNQRKVTHVRLHESKAHALNISSVTDYRHTSCHTSQVIARIWNSLFSFSFFDKTKIWNFSIGVRRCK
ncbi:hypothetical protein PanWU01x14_099850, partial [Parasponia andersonii]